MAVKYFCDKCGKELKLPGDEFIVTVQRGFDTIKTSDTCQSFGLVNLRGEVCGDCVKKMGFTID